MGKWKKAALLSAIALAGCANGSDGGGGGSGSSALSGGSGSGSGAISMAAAIGYAKAAGLACGNDLVIAGAIAMAESSLDPSETSTNGPTSGCPSGSTDRGLWQINSCYHSDVSDTCAFDPSCNAQAMASISSNGTDWSPWSTYTSGAYTKYMSEAQTAEESVCDGSSDDDGGSGTAGSGGSGAGGSSGSGTSGGKGSGGKGSGGKGGSSGSGSGGKGGKGGKGGSSGSSGSGGSSGYASAQPRSADRRHAVELASGTSETIPFTWHEAAGFAPSADLWIEEAGRAVLQVSSVGTHPFARAGLDVVPLEPGAPYLVVLSRTDDALTVSIVRATGEVLLRTQARAGDARTAATNVVLPGTFWRSSVVSDLL
jgi:hypothetical protein